MLYLRKMSAHQRYLYIVFSFVAGFALMTIEIISSRVIAPIIGSSIYSWAAAIGITLLGLAIGSIAGGILADRYNNSRILPSVFLISALAVFTIGPLSHSTDWIISSNQSIIFINVAIAAYLFLIPAIAIGLIQPIILKKYADNFSKIGYEYGLLSTAWSFGSILGVFITGFFLISTFGSTSTIYIVGLILLIVSGLIAWLNKERRTLLTVVGVLIIVVLCFFKLNTDRSFNTVYDQESSYYRIRVTDFDQEPFGQSRALILDFDTHSVESEKIVESIYTEIYPAFKAFKPDLKNIMVIGGGAYTLPKLLKSYYRDSAVSVIEIDPEVKKAAESFFGLDSTSIKTVIGDARLLINQNPNKYDLIYGDAYSSFISVPGHLLTREYNDKIKSALNSDGIYALNFIGSLAGKNSDLSKSILNTFAKSFPNYYVFAFGNNPEQIQSLTLIGLNSKNHQTESTIKEILGRGTNPFLAEKLIPTPKDYMDEAALILTDNFYPTEKLIASTIKDYFPDFLFFIRQIL